MSSKFRVVGALFATAFIGSSCGGSGSNGVAGPPTYESIAGTYAGALAGISQGITLQATFTLTITQSGGTLGGSYSLVGTVSDGVSIVPIQGTGTNTGTIASGNNPSVNIMGTSGICPNLSSPFSGAYDSVNRVITLNGSVTVFNASCVVVLSYPGTIILQHS